MRNPLKLWSPNHDPKWNHSKFTSWHARRPMIHSTLFTSESEQTAHLVLVLVDAVSTAVHLADKHLHAGVAGARLLERVLEPPPRAVWHHLRERHPLVLLEPARRRQIPHLGAPRAGRRSGGGGGVPGRIQRGGRRIRCLPGGGWGRGGAEAPGVGADRGGGCGGGLQALAHAKAGGSWARSGGGFGRIVRGFCAKRRCPLLPKVEKLSGAEGKSWNIVVAFKNYFLLFFSFFGFCLFDF